MTKISFDEFRDFNRWFSEKEEEIAKELEHYAYKTSLSELSDQEYGTTCGLVGNTCFENVSLEGDFVATLNTEEKNVCAGMFWVDLESEDEALKLRDEIHEGEGSARYSGEFNDGFVFEVE